MFVKTTSMVFYKLSPYENTYITKFFYKNAPQDYRLIAQKQSMNCKTMVYLLNSSADLGYP